MTFAITTDGKSLPADAVTQKFAFLGRSGSGKTYAAGKFVEELLDCDAQVVVVDPVGVWWGLRLAADGRTGGQEGFEVPIFGGQHGDIPLQATAGNLTADVIVDHGQSLVLDVSEFNGSEQRRYENNEALYTRSEIAEAVQMQEGSGGFNNYLSSLKNNGLIMKVDHGYRASDALFM